MSSRKQSWKIVALAVLALLPAGAARAQIGPGPFSYFPTGDVTDGRFLGFGCTGIATFEQEVNVGIAAPIGQVSFNVNIFDGDTGRPDSANRPHWDIGTRQLVYRLYADPFRQGSTDPGALIATWTGNDPNPLSAPLWTASAAQMPDNDWWGVEVTNIPAAQAPSGHYFYNLSIGVQGTCNSGELLASNIKVAASNPLAFLVPRFAVEAALRQGANDGPIIYPGPTFPPPGGFLTAPTTYDGTFEFFLELPPGETDLRLYDGDFDFGTAANLVASPSGILLDPCFDLDDLDTPPDYSNFPFPVPGASAEGIAGPGAPADDLRLDAFRRGELDSPNRLGCVRYEVIDPLGNIYSNDNPSGTFEWEQFRIATGLAVNPGDSDYQVGGDYLPPGIWTVRTVGLDMSNLNFWAGDACAVRAGNGGGAATWQPSSSGGDRLVTRAGELEPACPDINAFLLGDTVFLDLDRDGVQDPGENGIPGVVLNLYKQAGGPVFATVVTGIDTDPNWAACVQSSDGLDLEGLYCFGADVPGSYLIEIAPENFDAGRALHGLTSTTGGEQRADSLVDTNVLAYDFGYAVPTIDVGDRVWLDSNGDGVQDPGEPGLDGVLVHLLDPSGGLARGTATSGGGFYRFDDVPPGNFAVRVVAASLPAGLVPSYDLDGIGTPHHAVVPLVDTSRLDVDFGYRRAVSIGDRVWTDTNGDGVQDGGEAGIDGVTLELVDGAGNVVDTAVTASDGLYSFEDVADGSYTVRVVASTLPAGLAPTFDADGIGTAHTAAVTVGGANRDDVDFGYKQQATNPGTGTIGYWKNHPQAWPVQQITLGGVTYTKAQAIAILGQPSRGDKTIDLAKQLIAAKLNVIIGNDASCIAATIAAADAWLVQHPVGSNVRSSSAAWATGGPLHQRLDDYNNGRLCAPHRG